MRHPISDKQGIEIHCEIESDESMVIAAKLQQFDFSGMDRECERLLPDFSIPVPSSLPKFRKRHYGWQREDGVLGAPPKPCHYDVETSMFGHEMLPICAVAWDGEHWYLWLPSQAIERLIPLQAPFVAHNRSFDAGKTDGPCLGFCTGALANFLFLGTEEQQYAAMGNIQVPWSNVCLSAKTSLSTLSEFCKFGSLDKTVRDYCVEQDYGTNLTDEYLWEIVDYCAMDVLAMARIWLKLWTLAQHTFPNPAFWYGQYLMGGFNVPVADDFTSWFLSLQALIADHYAAYESTLEQMKLECYPELAWPIAVRVEGIHPLILKAFSYKKCVKPLKSYYKEWQKELKSLFKAALLEYENHCSEQQPLLDWTFTAGEPAWYRAIAAKATNNILPTFLGLTFAGSRIHYQHPNFPMVAKMDGSVSGRWVSDNLDQALVEGPECAFDWRAFIDLGLATAIFTKFQKRIAFMSLHDGMFRPAFNGFGTVTGRLTDPLLLVAPKHNKKVPGSELLGMFKAPEGKLFVHADYDSQEVGIMALVADAVSGISSASPFSKAGNEGDMHLLTWDALDRTIVPTRDKAKGFTFLVFFGGGASGAATRLELLGAPKAQADLLATKFIHGFKGKRERGVYVGGSASSYYNASAERCKRDKLTTLMGRPAPFPLQRRFCGNLSELTRGNYIIQGTGSDMLRMTYAYVDVLARQQNVDATPVYSFHDRPVWMTDEGQAKNLGMILQAAHLKVMAELYKTAGVPLIPERYVFFGGVDTSYRLQWSKDAAMVTPSNPNGFAVYKETQV